MALRSTVLRPATLHQDQNSGGGSITASGAARNTPPGSSDSSGSITASDAARTTRPGSSDGSGSTTASVAAHNTPPGSSDSSGSTTASVAAHNTPPGSERRQWLDHCKCCGPQHSTRIRTTAVARSPQVLRPATLHQDQNDGGGSISASVAARNTPPGSERRRWLDHRKWCGPHHPTRIGRQQWLDHCKWCGPHHSTRIGRLRWLDHRKWCGPYH